MSSISRSSTPDSVSLGPTPVKFFSPAGSLPSVLEVSKEDFIPIQESSLSEESLKRISWEKFFSEEAFQVLVEDTALCCSLENILFNFKDEMELDPDEDFVFLNDAFMAYASDLTELLSTKEIKTIYEELKWELKQNQVASSEPVVDRMHLEKVSELLQELQQKLTEQIKPEIKKTREKLIQQKDQQSQIEGFWAVPLMNHCWVGFVSEKEKEDVAKLYDNLVALFSDEEKTLSECHILSDGIKLYEKIANLMMTPEADWEKV